MGREALGRSPIGLNILFHRIYILRQVLNVFVQETRKIFTV